MKNNPRLKNYLLSKIVRMSNDGYSRQQAYYYIDSYSRQLSVKDEEELYNFIDDLF